MVEKDIMVGEKSQFHYTVIKVYSVQIYFKNCFLVMSHFYIWNRLSMAISEFRGLSQLKRLVNIQYIC